MLSLFGEAACSVYLGIRNEAKKPTFQLVGSLSHKLYRLMMLFRFTCSLLCHTNYKLLLFVYHVLEMTNENSESELFAQNSAR